LLLAERDVPVVPAPRVNAPHCPAEAVSGRLELDHPVAPQGPAPGVGEAQRVERPRTTGPWPALVLRLRRRRAERHEPRLGRVDAQTVLAEALRQDLQDALGIALVAKPDHESSGPGELHPQALAEPDVELAPHPALMIQSPVVSPSATERTAADRGAPPDPACGPRW